MVTERKVLSVVGFDVGFPLSYRSERTSVILLPGNFQNNHLLTMS